MKARIIAEVRIEQNLNRKDKPIPLLIPIKYFYIEVLKWNGWKKYGMIQGMDFSIHPTEFKSYEEAEKEMFTVLFKNPMNYQIKINGNKYTT